MKFYFVFDIVAIQKMCPLSCANRVLSLGNTGKYIKHIFFRVVQLMRGEDAKTPFRGHQLLAASQINQIQRRDNCRRRATT